MRQRDIKQTIYLNEKEYTNLQNNIKKLKLSQSEYLRSLIMNYEPKKLPNNKIMFEIIYELKFIGKTFNEIARQANTYDFINTRAYKLAYEKLNKIKETIKKQILNEMEGENNGQ